MNYCPLISFHKQYCSEVHCMGEDCMWWSSNEDTCLIRSALLKYVTGSAKETPSKTEELEAQLNILKQQVQAVGMGFPIYNFGGGNKIE